MLGMGVINHVAFRKPLISICGWLSPLQQLSLCYMKCFYFITARVLASIHTVLGKSFLGNFLFFAVLITISFPLGGDLEM